MLVLGLVFFSKYILSHTSANTACCVDISYDDEWSELFLGKEISYRKNISSSNADVVLLMDVLEHVPDDIALLSDYVNKVKSGTVFLISVPAFQFLWSNHDVFLEHKRRYTLGGISKVAVASGLSITSASYYFGTVFPIAATTRLGGKIFKTKRHMPVSQLKRHSAFVNNALKTLVSVELPFLHFNKVAGLTVFCLARKP